MANALMLYKDDTAQKPPSPLQEGNTNRRASLAPLEILDPVLAETEVPWLVEAAQEEVAAQVGLKQQRRDMRNSGLRLFVHQHHVPTCQRRIGTELLVRALAQLERLRYLWHRP